MSVNINARHLERSAANLSTLRAKVNEYEICYLLSTARLSYFFIIFHIDSLVRIKHENTQRLEEEYRRLVEGLREHREALQAEAVLANPTLPQEILDGRYFQGYCF